jgi:hypothetical protein
MSHEKCHEVLCASQRQSVMQVNLLDLASKKDQRVPHDASAPSGCDAVFLAPFVYEIEYKKKAKNKASQQQDVAPPKKSRRFVVMITTCCHDASPHTLVMMHTHAKE